jgi:CO/xanthine dehydrogenase Mo-binding subunit
VRRINFVPQSDFPYRPYDSQSVIHDSGDYQGCLDKAVTAFDYTGRREEQQRLRGTGRYRGMALPPIPRCAVWRRRGGSPVPASIAVAGRARA